MLGNESESDDSNEDSGVEISKEETSPLYIPDIEGLLLLGSYINFCQKENLIQLMTQMMTF